VIGIDPVLDLPLNEGSGTTVYDRSGFNNHGTIYNAVWQKIWRDWILYFNGQNAYVDCGNNPVLDLSNFTISAWIYPISWTHTSFVGIVSKRDSWTGMNWELYYDAGSSRIRFIINQILVIDGVNTNPPINKWSHLVYVKSGSTHKLFLNAINTDTATYSITPNTGHKVRIGVLGGDAISNAFKGYIGEVRILRKPLTDAQIQVLYNLFRGELRKPPSL
jgi:hypothetical protein